MKYFFHQILANKAHVLNDLLSPPSVASQSYNLRQCRHKVHKLEIPNIIKLINLDSRTLRVNWYQKVSILGFIGTKNFDLIPADAHFPDIFIDIFPVLSLSTCLLLKPPSSLIREPEGFRRRPGRPRQSSNDVVKKDLRKMDISWDEVEEAAEDRRSWRNRVAQCVFDAG